MSKQQTNGGGHSKCVSAEANAEMRHKAQQRQRLEEQINYAACYPSVTEFTEAEHPGVTAKAIKAWFRAYPEVEFSEGAFQRATKLAELTLGVNGMSDKAKKKAYHGFWLARAALLAEFYPNKVEHKPNKPSETHQVAVAA
jgi:hypothetical protein